MKVTINQIRKELEAIQVAHGMLNSFFWGDFLRAYKENTLDYPLMCCYTTGGGNLSRNLTGINLVIVICDKTFKDHSNLPDVESDMLQVCRAIFNVINKSPRWRKLVTVRSTSEPKFIERGGDEVAGYAMNITLDLKDSESYCNIPMFDYDFEAPERPPICEDGTVTINDSNNDLIKSVTAPSGGASTTSIQDSDIKLNGYPFTTVKAAGTTDLILLNQNDIQINPISTIGNSIKILTPEVLPSGTYIPKNTVVGEFDLLWLTPTANVTTTTGQIKKNSGIGWDGSSYAVLAHNGDFELSFNFDYSLGGSNAMFGLDFFKANNDYIQLDFAWYRNNLNAQIFEAGANVYAHGALINNNTLFSISRSGNNMIYKIDGVTVRTKSVTNVGQINLDCSIFDSGMIKNIKVVIQ